MTSLAQRGNLPGDLTSFVGRRDEIAAVRRLLGESRLVTLTGIGGVGKTRLALRVGAELERRFRDGVWLVDLAPLQDPGLVAQSVAASLGLRDESARWSLAVLTDYLAERQVLLLMDNCEHLLDACAVLVETLLRGAPELRVLATSRQPLTVPGEHTFTVPALPVPSSEGALPSLDAVAQYDAMVLLVDRARAVAPQFTITDDNVETVAQLVQRLDGIPLALELAAARLRVLSPRQVVERLDDRFRLLSSGARTARPHQQSLQALIDWSFDLCSPEERLLWARLSVFPHDFDLEAAETICSGDGLAHAAVLDALTGLVDKSIVIAEGDVVRVRYRLPETLREYGRGRLPGPDVATALRGRYRDYYRELGERTYEQWFGSRQLELTRLLQSEYVNLRAALEYCLAEPQATTAGLRLFPALYLAWSASGSLGEGRRLLDRALATSREPSTERAIALWVSTLVAVHQGDLTAAEATGREARRLAARYEDRQALASALVFLGLARVVEGDAVEGEALFREALDTVGQDDPQVVAEALIGLADSTARRGDVAAAAKWYEQCIALCEAHGESWHRAYALVNSAMLDIAQEERARATQLTRESLRIRVGFGDRRGIAECLEVLAWVAAAGGVYDRAATLLGAAQAVWKAVGASLHANLAPFHEECEASARRALGERAFQQSTQRGAQGTLHEAVADALAEKTAAPPKRVDDVSLTRREGEIAELVAQGMSNKEIAAKLVISQRTAEGHVEHVLVKLGFTSRAQIAAWVTERKAAPQG